MYTWKEQIYSDSLLWFSVSHVLMMMVVMQALLYKESKDRLTTPIMILFFEHHSLNQDKYTLFLSTFFVGFQ